MKKPLVIIFCVALFFVPVFGGTSIYNAVVVLLSELSDVDITTAADKDVLQYDSASATWKNSQDLDIAGDLTVGGSTSTHIQTLTGDTALDSTHSTVVVATSGSDITITLPTAASAYNATDKAGRIYNFTAHYDNVQNVIIEGNGSETINGELNIIAPAPEIWTVQSNGTEWFLVY